MELISLISPVITFIGAGLVWWLRGRSPAAATGFAAVARKIIEVVDKLDDKDDVKHEFTGDLFKLLREYTAPETPPVDVKAEIRNTVAGLMADLVKQTADAVTARLKGDQSVVIMPENAH